MEWVPAAIAFRTGGQIGKPSFDPGRCGEKPASVDHLAFFVERAVMTPDIAKIAIPIVISI